MNDGTTIEQKQVRITEFGARLLGEHALALPPADPARAYITMLLRRYSSAPAIETPTIALAEAA